MVLLAVAQRAESGPVFKGAGEGPRLGKAQSGGDIGDAEVLFGEHDNGLIAAQIVFDLLVGISF